MNTTSSRASGTSLLLVLPLSIHRTEAGIWIDEQALNGLNRWLDNFDRLTLCLPENIVSVAPHHAVPLDLGAQADRLTVVGLPRTYDLLSFLKVLRPTMVVLDRLIDEHTHLSFAIGGLFGDWGAIAALRASRKSRAASVWTDRVESAVARIAATRFKGARRLYRTAMAITMKYYERTVIRRTALGLFHGADCFDAYARFSPEPHLVHDVHLDASARITPADLAEKTAAAQRSKALSIIYAGRTHPDKGVTDWIRTLRLVADRGVDFVATWYGDGPELAGARAAVATAGLEQLVHFLGASQDREQMMRSIRLADIFLFCHQTLESPRCLVEALISGTPIVGYCSRYPQDLIAHHRGGILTARDPASLAQAVTALADDRSHLADLIVKAAADGHPFTDETVFRHRSELIKAAAVSRLAGSPLG